MQDVVGLFARIDADRLSRTAIANHPAVLLEGTDDHAPYFNLVDVRLARLVFVVLVADVGLFVGHLVGHLSSTRRRAVGD